MSKHIGRICCYRKLAERGETKSVVSSLQTFENHHGKRRTLATMENGDVINLRDLWFPLPSEQDP